MNKLKSVKKKWINEYRNTATINTDVGTLNANEYRNARSQNFEVEKLKKEVSELRKSKNRDAEFEISKLKRELEGLKRKTTEEPKEESEISMLKKENGQFEGTFFHRGDSSNVAVEVVTIDAVILISKNKHTMQHAVTSTIEFSENYC